MPKRIGDIDWSAAGGLGVPYNYEAEALAKKAASGVELTDAEWEKVEGWAKIKIAIAEKQLIDPVAWGWRTKSMEKALEYLPKAKVLVLLGGNRAGKTEIGTRVAFKVGADIPDAVVSVWHQDEKMSIKTGQSKMYRILPHEYNGVDLKAADKTKGSDFSLTWTQKNGFSDGVLILPPMHQFQMTGSEIRFKSFTQYQNNKQVAESYDSDLEWIDEEPPFELFKTLRSRINDRYGKILWTCTLIQGYGELAAFLLDGAETIETRYSEWLDEDLPFVQKSKNVEGAYIVYIASEDNPFVDFEEIKKGLSGCSLDEKRVRAYGVPSKRSMTKFPRLNANVHLWDDKTDGVPENKDCTHYMVCDPAGKKRWVMLWYKISKDGRVWVEREWPDQINYGPWALPSTSNQTNRYKGSPGPAQEEGSDAGMGFASYSSLIRKLETNMEWSVGGNSLVFQRRIDPRGNKTQQGADDFSVTTIGEMAKQGIFFLKADGPNDIDPGLQKINDYLEYNPSLPMGKDNQPKLMIHRRCGNLWSCMQQYNGLGGPEEHAKDFVDCLRYALMSNPVNIGNASLGFKKVKRY